MVQVRFRLITNTEVKLEPAPTLYNWLLHHQHRCSGVVAHATRATVVVTEVEEESCEGGMVPLIAAPVLGNTPI